MNKPPLGSSRHSVFIHLYKRSKPVKAGELVYYLPHRSWIVRKKGRKGDPTMIAGVTERDMNPGEDGYITVRGYTEYTYDSPTNGRLIVQPALGLK